jgi:hypothetical protein
VDKFEIIIHVGPSHYYNVKFKPSSVNFLYIIYSNLVLYMFWPLGHRQKDGLVNMKGNALQWRAIFAGSWSKITCRLHVCSGLLQDFLVCVTSILVKINIIIYNIQKVHTGRFQFHIALEFGCN